MQDLKNVKVIKVSSEDLKEIDRMMESYSENGELYAEFGIEEDTTLYEFKVEFDNGYAIFITVNSGQCNCYIDYIIYNPNGKVCSNVVGEDTLSAGDIIELSADNENFEIKIEQI